MTELLTYRNFKVGVEDFEKLITQKLVYIDKTSYLENLVKRAHVAQILRPLSVLFREGEDTVQRKQSGMGQKVPGSPRKFV